MSSELLLAELKSQTMAGRAKDVEATCKKGLDEGIPAQDLLNKGMLPGMEEVGEKFSCGDFFIPEMLVAARAMKTGLKVLEPALASNPAKSQGKVVIGTVTGDLHDIGKNLAGIMLTAAGFEVVDLGIDVGPERFVKEVKDSGAVAVGLSALLTTTMVNMENVVSALRESGFKGPVIVGGAPVTREFADKIGADLYAVDAAEGAQQLKTAVAA